MGLYEYEKEHRDILRKLAPECMVLLKQDGSFPIGQPCKIALYGSGARKTIKGGTGSGDVNVREYVTVEQGLEHAGFTVTTKDWLHAYGETYKGARKNFVEEVKRTTKQKGIPAVLLGMGAVMPEPEYEFPLDGEGELAVYVLARISGEGADRADTAGDFCLTQTEIRDIMTLERTYEKFLLALNVGGVVDLTPVQDVSNILLLSQTGMSIGDAFADVLLGKSYPSGKLTATWAAWEDYCHIGDFGGEDDTRYQEGIYVGYRYFDSVGRKPLYPFGYGLGYTSFEWENAGIEVEGSRIAVSVSVKNIGHFAGKEVIQLYVSVPSAGLDQPYQTLAAFAKTGELRPGEEKKVHMGFALEELASFDGRNACEILEAGDYILRVGNSSRNTQVCGCVRLTENITVSQLSHVCGKPDFSDWKPEGRLGAGMGTGSGSAESCGEDIPYFTVRREDFRKLQVQKQESGLEKAENGIFEEIKALVESLTDGELAALCIGGYETGGSKSFVGNAAIAVPGAAGQTAFGLEEKGIPAVVMADGPAGLRLSPQYGIDGLGMYPIGSEVPAAMLEFVDEDLLKALGRSQEDQPERSGTICDQYCSAIPIGTALAQSWEPEVCVRCGDLVGAEMERFGVHLWLAPALNIQRVPLCGRNFEYYSEDPLLSGKMAAGITAGVQKHPGCGVTIKHYACNNQETNRFHSNSIVSERALRDIYLRGFKIVVKEAMPEALMTSYNLLNGEHTSHRRDLVTDVLRGEWGFDGVVMSDWVTPGWTGGKQKYPSACASGSIKAGNDIMMPGGAEDYDDLMHALEDDLSEYPIRRENLEECAGHVIRTVWRLTGR